MRDIAVVAIAAFALIVTLRRPWLGVLALAFFGYASPHMYAWGFSTSLPLYQALLIAAFFSVLLSQTRLRLPADWRLPVFYTLWGWFVITTIQSPIGWAAWPKLWEVSKVYIPLILTLVLIDSRDKLFWLLATIGWSFGLLAAKGGVFSVLHGFHHRVWGPPGTMYGGNNEFAVATLVAVPLLVLIRRELAGATGWRAWVRRLTGPMIPLSVASAIGSWSRGALVTLTVLSLVLWWHSRHKLIGAALILGAAIAAPHFLPEEWFGRMETIETYEQDRSAMNRIEAWRDGWAYVTKHPITGAGFDGWRYVSERDWHSAYVEILAEHGFPGAFLWGLLVVGSVLSLTLLARRAKKTPGLSWVKDYAVTLRASLLAYMAGALTLGITYWDLLYQLVFCAIVLKSLAQAPSEQEAALASPRHLPGRVPLSPGSIGPAPEPLSTRPQATPGGLSPPGARFPQRLGRTRSPLLSRAGEIP